MDYISKPKFVGCIAFAMLAIIIVIMVSINKTETTNEDTQISNDIVTDNVKRKTTQFVEQLLDFAYKEEINQYDLDRFINIYGDIMTANFEQTELTEIEDDFGNMIYPIQRSVFKQNLDIGSKRYTVNSGLSTEGIDYVAIVTLNDVEKKKPKTNIYYWFKFNTKGFMLDYSIDIVDVESVIDNAR